MRRMISSFCVLILAVFSVAVNAQTTTLTYLGNGMTGTSTLLPSNFPNENCFEVAFCTTLVTESTTGAFDIQLTLSGSAAQNNLTVLSYSFNILGNNGADFAFVNLANEFLFVSTVGNTTCYDGSNSLEGCINVTTSGSTVTGATIHLATLYLKDANTTIDVAIGGDAFTYTVPGDA